MGYYTRHDLEIVENRDTETDYQGEISEAADYAYLFDEPVKWYDCEKDMETYSKKHPKVLFKVSGEGEENGDLWEMYIRNGKIEKHDAIITYPPYSGTL